MLYRVIHILKLDRQNNKGRKSLSFGQLQSLKKQIGGVFD